MDCSKLLKDSDYKLLPITLSSSTTSLNVWLWVNYTKAL